MALRRVVAAIDVVINGERNLDNLARGYARLDQMVQQVAGHLRTYSVPTGVFGANHMNAAIGGVRNLSESFGGMVNMIERNRAALDGHGRQVRGFTDNIVSLTRSMILFSVLLPLVRLPLQAIESFQNFIQVGEAWITQMHSINTLLQLQGDQYSQLDEGLRKVSVAYGVNAQELGASAKQIASTLGVIDNTAHKYTDLELSIKLTNDIARLSRAAFEDMGNVQEAVFTIFATGRLTVDQTTYAMNELFRTVQVGRTTFAQFNKDAGNFIPIAEDMIDAAPTAADRLDRLTGVLQTFAAASLSLGSTRASVGLGQIYQAIGRETPRQAAVVSAMEGMRRQQGLGQAYNVTGPALYDIASDPEQMFARLHNVLGPQSPLVSQEVARQQKAGTMQGTELSTRADLARRLAGMYFNNNVRALRTYESITPERLQEVKRQWGATGANPTDEALQQWLMDPGKQAERMGNAFDQLKVRVFDSIQKDVLGMNIGLSAFFERLMDDPAMQQGNFFQRIQYAAGQMVAAFARYFNSGGREQIQQFGQAFGNFIGKSITGFFSGGKDNVLIEAATAFSKSFTAGIGETLPDMLKAVLTSSVTRAVAEMVAIRYATTGMPGSRIMAVGGTGVLENLQGDGPLPAAIATAAGATLIGAASFAAVRRGMAARWQTPLRWGGTVDPATDEYVGGNTIASGGQGLSFLRNSALTRGMFARMAPVRTFFSGAWPGVGNIARMGSQVGGSMLLNLALAAPNLIQAMGDPDERNKWGSIGGTLGGVAGAGIGGLLGVPLGGIGSLFTGMAGGAVGGGIGNWAGGALFDMFHPSAGKGGTVADAGAPERAAMAEVMAIGMDTSTVPGILVQIHDLIARSTGAVVTRSTATTGSATAGTGTGGLTGITIDQQKLSGELGTETALAICGPMAAAYFARANGRNPNLVEAVELAKANYGGTFTGAGASGMSIAGVANLANKIGGGNIAQPFYGQPDWARLQGDVAAGKPGIVNVGPAGSFGGHFFQVAGYNAQTGQYDMGASGDVIGHKRYWTQDELQKLGGGVIGGVYYGGAAYGGGAPNTGTGASPAETEAYIRKSAVAHGINADAAVRAWIGEGSVTGAGQSNVYNAGVREPSFGPFQLHDKGWGASAGFNTRDPGNWQRNIDYALTRVASGGWDPGGGGLHGATAAGLSNWEGITRATGKGGVSEADAMALNGVEGGGGAQSPVTITIQNLMNVERMDGNTDVRALLGQMADILSKLSTGGSVVGQTGAITP